ncbi:hypothetical protein [Paraburkholderia sp. CNPSo 3281]|uniref:hypothetical protein n=1 Tax=Paraburkholderia sp. CNPSo 3281 TaxID=2940933 RepID=UPI0020B6BECA|nr:hypothetical protein [Paraburkholderia sp. CNPSo 3281]MCP3716447.1 hypothetical protein [Paraburkholderia sp. CNPSo 3281]
MAKLPPGILGRDFLTFLQLSVGDEIRAAQAIDDSALRQAMRAVRCGSMRAARPPMKVFFDGCQCWLASHLHRCEAAHRVGARHQEFWWDDLDSMWRRAV